MNRPKAKQFRDLIVWQKAHQLVLTVYENSKYFSKEELYGLTLQLKKAAVSIPANIAEGFKKKGKRDKVKFMNIAQGSLEECRYYFILSKDLGYFDTNELMALLEEVSKLLEAYSKSIINS